MAPDALPDPVIGLIQWLKDEEEEYDFWLSGREPTVTHYPQTKEAAPLGAKSALLVEVKSAGVGAGAGQIVQGRYESMRIDAMASAHNDWEAYQLGRLMHNAILQVRGRCVDYEYTTPNDIRIDYSTQFVNIYQSGGPAPFQDPFNDRPFWKSILYVYNVNYTTF